MKSKRKYILLLFGVLVAIFGADLSISAKALNVESEGALSMMNALPLGHLDPSFLYLISIGIIGLAVISRGTISGDSMTPHQKHLSNHGKRRSKEDRHM